VTTAAIDPITVKINRMFQAVDGNGDGYAEWNDFDRIAGRYLSAYKIAKDDRRALALRAAYQMYWMELLRHADVPADRLTKEQFQQALRALVVDTSRFNMVEGASHAVFDIMDVDGDNVISKSEFKQYLNAWDVTDPSAMDMFSMLDTDGDGYISRQEFIRATREFYYSPDLSVPGSFFFGRITG
jgi:Ca2+-binding EF-hand superfamily protein